jgi:UDP-N-acetylglucosamine--N-acetylmuramyl-(pentapeptide) pyrophosphoryl-undecaprenol N-acetylglucosamine transferase
LVPARGYELELLKVRPLRGAGFLGAIAGVKSAASALPASRALLREKQPSAVLSIGGYAAGPVSLAARTLGIPLALVEPNAEIGLSNRLVAPFVARAYTAFPESARFFRPSAVLETGVPLRAGFAARPQNGEARPARILILGGSQGAKTLNESLPRALSRLEQPITVLHQAGAQHEQVTRDLYAELGLAPRAKVTPFIEDMAEALGDSDLVVGRAGAGAVSEICAVGRASVLIPYPFAGDHQRFNALSLERRGAALTVLSKEATPERLHQEISALLADRARLSGMAERARSLGRPEAARAIAADLLSLAGLASHGQSARSPVATKGPVAMRFDAQELS